MEIREGPKVPVPVPCRLSPEAEKQRPKFVDDNDSLSKIEDVEKGSRLLKAALAQYHFWVRTLESSLGACAVGSDNTVR